MSTPAESRPPLRIGSKEREAAQAALSAHLDAGRLDIEEYGERYAQASLARTRPELDALFLDLPAPHPVYDAPTATTGSTAPTGTPSWAQGPPPRRRLGVARFVPALFVLIPIAAITLAASTGLWFLIFVIPASFAIFGHRGHHGHRGYYGPGGFCGPSGRRAAGGGWSR